MYKRQLKSCVQLGNKVNDYLVDWRRERESEHKSTIAFSGYQRESYIIGANTPRFGTGEAKGTLEESVRGDDLYIMAVSYTHLAGGILGADFLPFEAVSHWPSDGMPRRDFFSD